MLSATQKKVLDKIRHAPLDDGTMFWWEVKKGKSGTVTGRFNSGTIRALEKAGYIKILRDSANRHYFDTIKLLK